ncbi:MAG: aldo/keto reductase [Planctomycetota bacterium]
MSSNQHSEAASADQIPRRQLGNSDLFVSAIGLGLWPIAGVSTLGTTEADSLATIHQALDCGINFIDTAYSYGFSGESDQILSRVLHDRRQEMIVATKVGQYFNADRQRCVDASPKTIRQHAEESLHRLGLESLDILYLHCPDPNIPISDSAGAILDLVESGKVRYAGISNVNTAQLKTFHEVCPVVVAQPPYNMLQPDAVSEIQEICSTQSIGIACYWALMKGLLAGHFERDHEFDPADKRLTYEIYQGEAWIRAQDLLDELRIIAKDFDCTVAQLVLSWTIQQPNITSALCGAKRPEQIYESAETLRVAGRVGADATAIEAIEQARNRFATSN